MTITGDMNTNVGSTGYNLLVNALRTFYSILDLTQINKEPTRVCESSKSIIDLLLVSDFHKISQQGVIECGMSDHIATYCSRKVSKQQVNVHNRLNLRYLKHYSKEQFCERFTAVNWFPVITCNDIDQAGSNFKTAKTIRVKQRSEPWFTGDKVIRR